jgi:hypothetical protein
MQKLLADIRDRKVDIVVVCNVDIEPAGAELAGVHITRSAMTRSPSGG